MVREEYEQRWKRKLLELLLAAPPLLKPPNVEKPIVETSVLNLILFSLHVILNTIHMSSVSKSVSQAQTWEPGSYSNSLSSRYLKGTPK